MKLAVMGAGLMGRPIAERLQASGHSVTVYSRTPSKAATLRKAGITVVASPAEAIRPATGIILMLSDAAAIRDVLLSDMAGRALLGRTVIQMGTISPSESRALEQQVMDRGGDYLEAPVLGSHTEARAGTLQVMVGCTEDQFARWGGLLQTLGAIPLRIGSVGQAAALKLALNQLIAAEISAFSLSLGFIQRSGIPVDLFMTLLRASALYAPAFDNKLPRLLKRDYSNPNFAAMHLLKDVELFLREAEALQLDTTSLTGIPILLRKAQAQGLAESDYSAVYESVDPRR